MRRLWRWWHSVMSCVPSWLPSERETWTCPHCGRRWIATWFPGPRVGQPTGTTWLAWIQVGRPSSVSVPLDDVVFLWEGVLSALICTSMNNDRLTAMRANLVRPSGLSCGWAPSSDPLPWGETNSVPCPRYPGRRHLLLDC